MPAPLRERLTIRASLALGVFVTLALGVYTGYTFTRRFADAEQQAADVATRYLRAQELLTSVRTQMLVASVIVRDALLDPTPGQSETYRNRILQSHAAIQAALDEYVPVVRPEAEFVELARLREGVGELRASALEVLDRHDRVDAVGRRQLLDQLVVPRREAAIRISEEVQALNREAFVAQQVALARVHRSAAMEGVTRLGWAFAVAAAALLLVGVYAARLERRLLAENRRSAGLSRQLQAATMHLMHAQEHERRTIARELHDEVGQVLTTVKVELGLARRAVETGREPGEALSEAQAITSRAIQTVRDISQLLHPAALDDLGLAAAIEALVRGLERRQVIQVSCRVRGLRGRLAPEVEAAAYRIVQEAITNVARHSRASACSVELTCSPSSLVLEITDNGVGFSVQIDESAEPAGLGLIGIRERVAELGGRLELASAPGRGVRLVAELPLTVADQAREVRSA